VGARPVPGSAGGRDEGRRQFDHLAQYGRGRIIDDATGQYEWYDLPDSQAGGEEVDWDEILAQPRLIAADFAAEYQIRLAQVGNRLSWREFAVLVEGLLSSDSRLARHFTRAHDTDRPDRIEEVDGV
jgi:hypothetical protein